MDAMGDFGYKLEDASASTIDLSTIIDVLDNAKLERLLGGINFGDNKITIRFGQESDEVILNIDKILKVLLASDKINKDTEIVLEHGVISGKFTAEFCRKLINVQEQILPVKFKMGQTVLINQFRKSISTPRPLEDWIMANAQIDSYVKKVTGLTIEENGVQRPLNQKEIFMLLYNRAISFVYKDSEIEVDGRGVVDVLNNKSAICTGFATLLKELCEAAGIACEERHVYFGRLKEGHSTLYVVLDNKVYATDPTGDCLKGDAKHSYSRVFCLYPVSEEQFITEERSSCTTALDDLEKSKKQLAEKIEEITNIKPKSELSLSALEFNLTQIMMMLHDTGDIIDTTMLESFLDKLQYINMPDPLKNLDIEETSAEDPLADVLPAEIAEEDPLEELLKEINLDNEKRERETKDRKKVIDEAVELLNDFQNQIKDLETATTGLTLEEFKQANLNAFTALCLASGNDVGIASRAVEQMVKVSSSKAPYIWTSDATSCFINNQDQK